MNIYCAHPFTREYVGQSLADADPLEPENWLIPANAYVDPPPASVAGQAVVRSEDGRAWQLVADYRGTVYDIVTGDPRQHDALGDLPDDLTTEQRPGPFHVWVSGSWLLNAEAQSAAERYWRDGQVTATEWLVTRHRDEQDMQLATTLTPERFSELLVYRQGLRDWPQSSLFPDVEQRPAAPSWIAEQHL
ncbi:phage tail assembly chaperone [Pseudomonas defluvii]|uniref:phage tail assembly chaperone n=1 Tax=Pseudomonas defluvii TaxID=1876757 RepID=UPI00081143F9|nr:phage tail assembly chaperone [Pseudomonas defluvii]